MDEMTLDEQVLDRLIVVCKVVCTTNKTNNAHTALIFSPKDGIDIGYCLILHYQH